MWLLAEICVVPMGVGPSVSAYVAACQEVFEQAGLHHEVHAYGTNVEGEWDAVMAALRACHERLHEMGVPRIHTSVKLGTRSDKAQSLADKVASVRGKA